MDHTQPKNAIQDAGQPHRTKENNTVIKQYNPLKDLTRLYKTIQYNERLNRTAENCRGEKGLLQITSSFFFGNDSRSNVAKTIIVIPKFLGCILPEIFNV